MKRIQKAASLLCALLVALGLPGCGSKQAKEIPLPEVQQNLQQAYGERYLAVMDYDTQVLETVFGIKPEWIEEYVAQGPAMSAHVDTLIAIRATDGNAKNVKKALEEYRQSNIDSGFQYPMNVPKLEQSTVYQTGDYVFFIMLGGYYEGDDPKEETQFYQQQTQIALDIIQSYE